MTELATHGQEIRIGPWKPHDWSSKVGAELLHWGFSKKVDLKELEALQGAYNADEDPIVAAREVIETRIRDYRSRPRA